MAESSSDETTPISKSDVAIRGLIERMLHSAPPPGGPPPLAPDECINERYRVVRRVGQGGFSVVYQVFDQHCQRHSTLKLGRRADAQPPRELDLDPSSLGIKLQVLIDHGVHREHPFLIYVPYLEGETLHNRIGRAPLDEAEALRSAHELAIILLELNRKKSIIHRDVKPSNVFIDSDGDVWLLDLGLACATSECRVASRTCGTPGYTAPEVLEGGPLTSQVDVFAAALSLYVSLGGPPPESPEGKDGQRFFSARISHTQLQKLKVSSAVRKVILAGCEPSVSRRPDIQSWEQALGSLRQPQRTAGSRLLAWLMAVMLGLTIIKWALAGVPWPDLGGTARWIPLSWGLSPNPSSAPTSPKKTTKATP